MSTGELNACAFCMDTTDVGLAGDGVTLEVTRAGLRSSQFVWSHRRCLDERLHERITRGEWFDD
ncbi:MULTISPECIES: hypothetical protein [Streptomyces]|uniref:PARP-type domain-containing protein n=1 Tax=Streptomyces mutomycini TaxID=284036 RepID=A0ABW0B566_9ACTN|nr:MULTISPECIES: hypothetical protein [Streptomyces]KPC82346.1 hypothetical protein ADK82_13690 [Streptomyces sp. NRRL S-4]